VRTVRTCWARNACICNHHIKSAKVIHNSRSLFLNLFDILDRAFVSLDFDTEICLNRGRKIVGICGAAVPKSNLNT
jgi:hypothetical protein